MPNKLNLSDNIILQKILKQHLYYDKKSKDPHINRIKPKYKLAGNCILSDYFFHVLTTRKGAYKQLSHKSNLHATQKIKLGHCRRIDILCSTFVIWY